MIVIVIMGILATLLIPRIMDRPEEARRVKAKMDIKNIESALKLYKLDCGNYPTTEQGLDALVKKPSIAPVPAKWRDGGYLEGICSQGPVETSLLLCLSRPEWQRLRDSKLWRRRGARRNRQGCGYFEQRHSED